MVNINTKHWKPFGCPIFVLDENLQTGKTFNKWKQRARVGIYLGQSPIHNQNVALVLNRNTGHVSPQFHVKFDSSFHSVRQDHLDCTWQQSTFFVTAPLKRANKRMQEKGTHLSEGAHKIPRLQTTDGPSNNAQSDPIQHQNDKLPQLANDGTPSENANAGTSMTGQTQQQQQFGQREVDGPPQINQRMHSEDLRCSKRTSKPPQRLIEVMKTEIAEQTIPGELFSLATMFPVDDTMDQPHSVFYCYKAADSDPDTMYHHQAMRQLDREQFRTAMQKEMDDQMANGNFELVQRAKIPIGTKVFPAVWQMRRKCDIKAQEVKKWKARLNFDGSRMQRGEHYDQSYAPVASWSSI